MKKLILTLIITLLAGNAMAQVHVRGHFRSNGTYVQPHYRSAPDGIKFNNYSNW